MKFRKLFSAAAAMTLCAAMLSSCSDVPKNTVFSIADLEGKTIGVQLGTVGDMFASEVKDATVEKYNKGADAVQALKQGKIDAVIIDIEPAKVFTEKNTDLMMLDESYGEEKYAVAVKKGNDELTEKINTALSELQADGTLDQIKSNWIGDEAGTHPYTTPESAPEKTGTLTMATNAEFPPYELMKGEDIVGLDIDMMRAVSDKLGMELKIENMEFDSIIAAVDSGKADVGAAGLTVTPERMENVNFTDPYTTSKQVVIVRK